MGLKDVFRLRNIVVWMLTAALMGVLFETDPDGGSSMWVYLIKLTTGFFFAVTLAHIGRRVLFDYPEADARSTFDKARETSTGAGLLAVAISIVTAALLLIASSAAKAQDVETYIPKRCFNNLGILKAEQRTYWPDHPQPEMLAALAEHESCISLKHSRCCNITSRLKSAREEGAGLGQITRAYRADGSIRFDALAEMRDKHPVLADWSWENVYQRADLQNRALVLKSKDNVDYFLRLGVPMTSALHFGDAGYNGGNGGVQNDRKACKMSPGCDPKKWFGNVERFCTKSRVALYGQRSACDINRHHVHDVVHVRSPKYEPLF